MRILSAIVGLLFLVQMIIALRMNRRSPERYRAVMLPVFMVMAILGFIVAVLALTT